MGRNKTRTSQLTIVIRSERYVSIPTITQRSMRGFRRVCRNETYHQCSGRYYNRHIGTSTTSAEDPFFLTVEKRNVLRPKTSRIAVRSIAQHPVIHNIDRVRDSIAPERLSLNLEIRDAAVGDVGDREGYWTSISVVTSAIGEEGPPRLSNVMSDDLVG